MKNLMLLWQVAADELAARCSTSTSLDFKTLQARVDAEGLSFLTISLTNFGSGFHASLDRGYVSRDSFPGFRWTNGLPTFLSGFLELIFDRSSGQLVEDPSIEAIHAVRQLTLMFGKLSGPDIVCTPERVDAAIQKFFDCEKDVQALERSLSLKDRKDFARVSALLFADVFSEMDRKVFDMEFAPKHGPGATADRLRGNAKFDQTEWPTRMEYIFPYGEMCLTSWRYHDRLDRVNFLEPDQERPVRVVTVPKTLKTPRIIAIEPSCMMYVQQSLMNQIVPLLENETETKSSYLVASCGFLGFRDQTLNQDLAMIGSQYGNLATLDLSEASDRVSNLLVETMLARWPHFREAIDACRSRRADINGKVISLAKFASMGSAMCFPMEAMVFLTTIFIGIERSLNCRLTKKIIKDHIGGVRVFGDDIIVAAEYVDIVMETLETFGFKVNTNKSFWTGRFRESCGKEYYDGQDVSIVRVRTMLPSSRHDVEEVVSSVSLRNRMYLGGLWGVASHLDEFMTDVLRHFPVVSSTSSLLGRWSFLGWIPTHKLHPGLQVPMVKGYVIRSRIPASVLDGENALLKFFLKEGEEPFFDKEHLQRYGRSESVDIKLRWAPS